MISIAILFVFLCVSGFIFYHVPTGYALVIATRLLIPGIVRVNLFVIDLSLNSGLTLMLIAGMIFNHFIRGKKYSKLDAKFLKPFLKLLIPLLLLAFLGYKMSIADQVSAFIQFLFTEFLICFLGWIIFTNKEDIRLFVKINAIVAFIISLYGIFCYLTLSNPYVNTVVALYSPEIGTLRFMDEARAGLAGRIQGTMTHPLMWGGSCLLLFYFFLNNNDGKKIKPYIIYAILGLLFLNIIFSGSRASLLGLIIGLGFYLINAEAKTKIRLIGYSLIVLTVVLILLYMVPELDNYKDFFEATVFFWDEGNQAAIRGSSASGRLDQLNGAIDIIKQSPMVGLGQGFIKYYSSTFGVHPILLGFESIVFMALTETGYIGMTVWVLFFLSIFFNVRGLKKYKMLNRSQLTFFTSFIVAYFLFSVFTGFQSTLYLFLVFYTIQLKYNVLI